MGESFTIISIHPSQGLERVCRISSSLESTYSLFLPNPHEFPFIKEDVMLPGHPLVNYPLGHNLGRFRYDYSFLHFIFYGPVIPYLRDSYLSIL